MAGLCPEGHNPAMRITRWPHKLRRFSELSIADKWLFLRAVFWLAVARIELAKAPLERLATGSAQFVQKVPDPELLHRIGFAVAAASANVPWRSDCFPQALAARSLLARYGYPAAIHLGVERTGETELAGHAWVTCGDVIVVGGEELDRYTEMSSM